MSEFHLLLPNAHNQAPRGRVRAPPKVACIVMFGKSKVFGCEAGALCDLGKHARSDFLTIVKSECVVGPPRPREDAVRAMNVTLHRPPDPEECGENTLGLG